VTFDLLHSILGDAIPLSRTSREMLELFVRGVCVGGSLPVGQWRPLHASPVSVLYNFYWVSTLPITTTWL